MTTTAKSGKYRAFVLTLWPHVEEDILERFRAFAEEHAKFAICGREVCPSTGRPHYQADIEFVNQRALTALQKRFWGHYVQPRRGAREQSADYCQKENLVFKFGKESEQGERNDLKGLCEQIEEGKRADDVAIENPAMYHQYGRTLHKVEDVFMRRRFRTEMTEGIWIFGPTGVGKSHEVFADFSPLTHYVLPKDGGWWDQYQQQDTVIINEFRGEIAYSFLLELVDKWPVCVRRRCREPMPFISKRVIVTSSLAPEDVYRNLSERDSLAQLYRRFKVYYKGDISSEMVEHHRPVCSMHAMH